MTVEANITLRAIVLSVATARRVPERLIYSQRQGKEVAAARGAVYWLARELPGLSSSVIGRMLHRDHSTVLAGAKTVEEQRKSDPALAAELDRLKADLIVAARAKLAPIGDTDPIAAARQVASAVDPVAAGLRVSALDIAAMARRSVDLEEVAAATFHLLARCDEAQSLAGAAAREFAAGTRELIEGIADALAALGYEATEQQPVPATENVNAG